MKFVDEATIEVHAGKGGDGIASFRREKFIPRGGPDGGDGGRGGSIHAVADRNINTLVEYRYARIHRARNGEKGQGSDCYGKAADDITAAGAGRHRHQRPRSGEVIADLAADGQTAVLAKGGQGGLGNIHFKSSTNRAPRQCTPGGPGESRNLKLELKVLADVGLLGHAERRQVHLHPLRFGRASQGRRLSVHDAAPEPGRGARATKIAVS